MLLLLLQRTVLEMHAILPWTAQALSANSTSTGPPSLNHTIKSWALSVPPIRTWLTSSMAWQTKTQTLQLKWTSCTIKWMISPTRVRPAIQPWPLPKPNSKLVRTHHLLLPQLHNRSCGAMVHRPHSCTVKTLLTIVYCQTTVNMRLESKAMEISLLLTRAMATAWCGHLEPMDKATHHTGLYAPPLGNYRLLMPTLKLFGMLATVEEATQQP